MATIPTIPLLRRSDYDEKGLGTQPALDRFFAALNPFLQAASKALTGAVNIGNMNGEVIKFQVTTPATDWVTATLAGTWTSTTAQSNGFGAPRYRINQSGQVQITGACEHATAVINALPANIITGLPVTSYNQDITNWVQLWDNAGARWIGSANLRIDSTGALTFRAWSGMANGAAGTANAVEFLALDNCFYTPANPVPGVLSCFPIRVKLKGTLPPQDLWITSVLDADQSTQVPLTALGVASWTRLNAISADLPNSVSISNIPGLALGRTYNVRAWVQY